MPAYNAGRTLRLTYEELPKDTVSLVILVDDGSTDGTLEVARQLGLEIFVHNRNYGYGANQENVLRGGAAGGGGHRSWCTPTISTIRGWSRRSSTRLSVGRPTLSSARD